MGLRAHIEHGVVEEEHGGGGRCAAKHIDDGGWVVDDLANLVQE